MAAQASGNPTGIKWDSEHHFAVAEFSTGRKVSVHFNADDVFAVAPDGQAKKTEVQRLIRHYRESGTAKQLLALEQVDAWQHLDRFNVDVMRMIVNFVASVDCDDDHAFIGKALARITGGGNPVPGSMRTMQTEPIKASQQSQQSQPSQQSRPSQPSRYRDQLSRLSQPSRQHRARWMLWNNESGR
jgi:hypothetical protein